jgi:hypothetical protein
MKFINATQMKMCRRCGEEKRAEAFRCNSRVCRACHNARQMEQYYANWAESRAKSRERGARWRANNPERNRAVQQAYRQRQKALGRKRPSIPYVTRKRWALAKRLKGVFK